MKPNIGDIFVHKQYNETYVCFICKITSELIYANIITDEKIKRDVIFQIGEFNEWIIKYNYIKQWLFKLAQLA